MYYKEGVDAEVASARRVSARESEQGWKQALLPLINQGSTLGLQRFTANKVLGATNRMVNSCLHITIVSPKKDRGGAGGAWRIHSCVVRVASAWHRAVCGWLVID